MKKLCRVCGCQLDTAPILVLDKMPLTDDFISQSSNKRTEFLEDIEIYQCGTCGIVQNPNDFDIDSYYSEYEYTSGTSVFTQEFMERFARATIDACTSLPKERPGRVLEIGSGDGQQLMAYRNQGFEVLGIEPSTPLADIANDRGIDTQVGLFGINVDLGQNQFDICVSSYTFDHVQKPLEYLNIAHSVLRDGGILAIEIHDLDLTISRAEFCLFEHEHTVYMTAKGLMSLVSQVGFEVLNVNPIDQKFVRGNSLIILARKVRKSLSCSSVRIPLEPSLSNNLQSEVDSLIHRIEAWGAVQSGIIVGFGAGGRGVMTTCALNSINLVALLDSNFSTGTYLSPKKRLPIIGPDSWRLYRNASCIVFSFGYFDEIKNSLIDCGFDGERIVSLADFFGSSAHL